MTATNLIPTREVAALKGVTVKTVNLWAQQGKLPVADVEKLSGARFFDVDVVAQFNPKAPVSTSPEVVEAGAISISGGAA